MLPIWQLKIGTPIAFISYTLLRCYFGPLIRFANWLVWNAAYFRLGPVQASTRFPHRKALTSREASDRTCIALTRTDKNWSKRTSALHVFYSLPFAASTLNDRIYGKPNMKAHQNKCEQRICVRHNLAPANLSEDQFSEEIHQNLICKTNFKELLQ